MDLETLKNRFYELVAPSLPNEWDVEEALISLAEAEAASVDDIFAQVPAIWPVSHSLCFAYLSAAGAALGNLAGEERALWVHTLLDRYETGGLRGAQLFMDDIDQQFVRYLRGQGGLRLCDVRARLQPYVNGLAGREMVLMASESASTDAQSIFLPREIGVFAGHEENFLLYKLMVSFQWACLEAGTFAAPPDILLSKKAAHPLDCFFSEFTDAATARSLYHFFETCRILSFLQVELPGLMRDAASLLPQLPLSADAAEDLNLLDRLQLALLRDQWPEPGGSAREESAVEWLKQCRMHTVDNQVSLEAVRDLMAMEGADEDLSVSTPLIFQGTLRLQEMRNAGMKRHSQKELRLIQTMTARLQRPAKKSADGTDEENLRAAEGGQEEGTALILTTEKTGEQGRPQLTSLRIDNKAAAGQEETATAADLSRQEASTLSQHTNSAVEGKPGQSYSPAHKTAPGEGEGAIEPVVYDEWDYRRKGFRKNWCVVTEKQIQPVQTTFIEQTLRQYRGQIRRLRHQFELLQTGEHFVRRQREGNDIDLDALVESLADAQAGLPPSDRLFIRLAREQRDIAVYFLVDMSNSTAGWVGQAIKEALVLICEAMEVLHDRYGIYGFSGMRRLRCEVFPVKQMDERYTRAVRQRISALGPREYTRMAPAIRHMTSLFSKVEARIRLLIVLSDGKPEDYDDYKGTYAVEDTRHALLEAKAQGIHPFCITIDRQAHEYMAHMYGEVNYIFVDKVHKLPARMSEIYRTLTS